MFWNFRSCGSLLPNASSDPRWNRAVGESGRPIPIALDRRLFTDNPILRGEIPVVPFNIISEQIIPMETTTVNEANTVNAANAANEVNTVNAAETEADTEDDLSSKCITCLDKDRDALFMPCRHLMFCLDCARIQTEISNLCPMCRNPIGEVMNIFR